jgi:hypothetical protein
MIHFYPQGALQTVEELEWANEAFETLFLVNGLGEHSFMQIEPTTGEVYTSKYDTVCYGDPNSHSYGTNVRFCPSDFNIGGHHNQHYVFTKSSDAEAYLKHAKYHTRPVRDFYDY